MKIEVTYALPKEQILLEVDAPEDVSIEAAINASGILSKFPEIDLATNKVGIFGKVHKLGDSLQERDRIEIYRPITCDPKEVRRQRAKKDNTE